MAILLALAAGEATGQTGPSEGEACSAYRQGDSIWDDGPSTEPWVPFPSTDLLVWGADACLGFFMTRDQASLNGGILTDHPPFHRYVELGDMRARIVILDFPFDEYGVFQCENTTWPERVLTQNSLDELQRWIAARLTPEAGWQGTFDRVIPDGWRFFDLGRFRNDRLGLSLGVGTSFHERRSNHLHLTVRIYADYFGPPVMMDSDIRHPCVAPPPPPNGWPRPPSRPAGWEPEPAELLPLIAAIQGCWSPTFLPSEAARISVTVAFELGRDARLVGDPFGDVELVAAEGGDDERAIMPAFEAARRAILRCQGEGFPLLANAYDRWRLVELTFDPVSGTIQGRGSLSAIGPRPRSTRN